MKLKVIGSGSSGNCYLLEDEEECLVIEAGIPFIEVKKALNFNISKIVGVIISHIHSDHAKYGKEFKDAGIPVYQAWELTELDDNPEKMKFYSVRMGRFKFKPFPNRTAEGKWLHNNTDGSECPCYGFWIYHPDMGRLVYASDTECVVQRFHGINHILVEANYAPELLDREDEKFQHQVSGHMSIDTACGFLQANKSPELQNVILCHLSASCSSPDEFLRRAKEVVECDVNIAVKGLEVDLSLDLF